jgi:hypothetical protein
VHRFAYLALLSIVELGAQGGRTNVNPANPMETQLASQIAIRNGEHAKTLASKMPPEDVGRVLMATATNPKDAVRILTLELASEYPSVGASRAILGRLSDADATVRSVAGSLIGRCTQSSLVPELLETMKLGLPDDVRGALARQVGLIGGPDAIQPLNDFYRQTHEPGFRRDLSVAMARLGQQDRKTEAIARLNDPDANHRVEALRDMEYIGDKTLVRFFAGVLKDRRDVLDISPPHEMPVVWVRVCDVAIQSMAILGIPLSFGGLTLHRWNDLQVAEAVMVVEAMQK